MNDIKKWLPIRRDNMSRPGITYHDVANAAQQLAAQGKNPTIDGVRSLTGTGSTTTIAQHLKEWKYRQDHTRLLCLKENLPEEIVLTMKGLWERVVTQAEEKVAAIKQDFEQSIDDLKDQSKKLQESNTHWQQQYQQIKKERDGVAHEKLAVEQLLVNAKVEIATLTEKLIGFEQQHQEKQARIGELRQQNQQIQANLEHYRTASLEQRMTDKQRYEQQQNQLEQTIQQIKQELTQVHKEKLAFQQQYHQADFENESLKTQFAQLNVQHELITTRLTESLNELAMKTQDQQNLQEQLKILQIKFEDQCQVLVETKTQNAVLLQQSELMKYEINELHEKNKVLAHEKWELGQEKAQLYGQLKQLESYA